MTTLGTSWRTGNVGEHSPTTTAVLPLSSSSCNLSTTTLPSFTSPSSRGGERLANETLLCFQKNYICGNVGKMLKYPFLDIESFAWSELWVVSCVKSPPPKKKKEKKGQHKTFYILTFCSFCRFLGRPGDYNKLFGARQEEVGSLLYQKHRITASFWEQNLRLPVLELLFHRIFYHLSSVLSRRLSDWTCHPTCDHFCRQTTDPEQLDGNHSSVSNRPLCVV